MVYRDIGISGWYAFRAPFPPTLINGANGQALVHVDAKSPNPPKGVAFCALPAVRMIRQYGSLEQYEPQGPHMGVGHVESQKNIGGVLAAQIGLPNLKLIFPRQKRVLQLETGSPRPKSGPLLHFERVRTPFRLKKDPIWGDDGRVLVGDLTNVWLVFLLHYRHRSYGLSEYGHHAYCHSRCDHSEFSYSEYALFG